MIELTLQQALSMADIYDSDNDLVRDLKFGHCIADRKYRIVSPGYHPVPTDVEILIIKDKEWKAITT